MMSDKIFVPSPEMISDSNLFQYMGWLKKRFNLEFEEYADLWKWSVEQDEDFWKSIVEYFNIDLDIDRIHIKSPDRMPNTRWFENATINYASYLIRHATPGKTGLIECDESGASIEIAWDTILNEAAHIQKFLEVSGLKEGDRVVAYLPNIKETSIAFLACAASGWIWSVCSPDFGDASVIDRFKQIEPKALIAVDQYQYGGKTFDKSESVIKIIEAIPSINTLILVKNENDTDFHDIKCNIILWDNIINSPVLNVLRCKPLPFNHPIWILYSSGTTGLPKAITHSHGGMLLEHLKYIHFHNDVKPGQRFFWFTTTGWMMWNYLHATWLAGATIVLYNGSPMYPDRQALWRTVDSLQINHFGTGAPYIHACMKESIRLPSLVHLQSIGSTGSPLSSEAYHWIYNSITHPIFLWSMSGGTDVASAFVGGCPLRPVYIGEIQCRTLGCDLDIFDESGNSIIEQEGELVIKQSMPCMPVYFWNDEGGKKYHESYFDHYPGIWRHGDWVTLTKHDGLIISGRSDTTLKRQGIRIGTSEIYAALLSVQEVEDSLIIHIEKANGTSYMPLFVKLKPDKPLGESLSQLIKNTIKTHCSPRHIPDQIIQVKDIPYTLSGKKMEAAVKKLFKGKNLDEVAAQGAMRNPESLKEYEKFALVSLHS